MACTHRKRSFGYLPERKPQKHTREDLAKCSSCAGSHSSSGVGSASRDGVVGTLGRSLGIMFRD